MKFLHTSDWHLGRSLYGRRRYAEFEAFLNWLAQTIEDEAIDALLVAGDVFDTSTPSNQAQELYYRFLCRVASSCCRHVVIIAGNHDSPSFINAPKELLRALNVHVVGAMTETLEDEVIILRKDPRAPQIDADNVEALVCAVPYLRDKDIPIIAMGHLFSAGGKTVDGDGVRELYVGSLAHISADVFPASIDYLALGHLHVPQAIGATEHMRYSGSLLPMGYGEAKQENLWCWWSSIRRCLNLRVINSVILPQKSPSKTYPVFNHWFA